VLVLIESLLTAAEAAAMRAELLRLPWQPGAATAADLARDVKRNRQLPAELPAARARAESITAAAMRHPTFVSAALPRRVLPPRFNRHGPGERYGVHVDAALMQAGDGTLFRADVSATLFLSDADAYEGGELEIETACGPQQVKAGAGDLVLYPASTLHRVCEVTAGERVCAFFWVESLVADAAAREVLHDLDVAIQALRADPAGDAGAVLRLTRAYHALVRRWARA
jgi:PKHD-type hydroxylase